MPKRYSYVITEANHDRLVQLKACSVLQGEQPELNDLINLAIERMFEQIVEELKQSDSKYRRMLAEVLDKNRSVIE